MEEAPRSIESKALRTLASMKPLLRSPLSLNAKLLLYKTYIVPMKTYASPAWAFITKSSMQHLKVVIGGYDWYKRIDKMHLDLEIPKL